MGVGGASGVTEQVAATLDRFPGGPRLVDGIEYLVAWARANSLWPLVYGTACCAMEMMSAGSSRHDWARFGVEVARATPRQADLIVLAGTIVDKMAANLITLYEQMPAPKYVIAMGSCAISGGPFYYDTYSVVRGGDRLIPVDVYVPGCPPRPEALLYGIMELQEKIRKEGRRNPWRVGRVMEAPFSDTFSLAREEWAAQEKEGEEERLLARERFKAENPDYRPPKPQRPAKERFEPVARQAPRQQGLSNAQIFAAVQRAFPGITLFRQPEITPATVAELAPDTILDLVVPPAQYRELARFLKNDPEIRCDLLLQVTAVDWQERFDLLVHLLSSRHGHKVFLRCPVEREGAEIASITDLFRGAEWHEREVFDLFGIRFAGHPDLRRIFLQNDFPGHPLRKDFDDPSRVVKRPY